MTASILIGMGSAAMLLIVAFVALGIARSSERGTLARNGSVGIRSRATLASDAAWEAGHRAGGARLRICGLGALIGAALGVLAGFLPLLGGSEMVTNSAIATLIIATSVWVVAWALAAGGAANRAARAVTAAEG